MNKYEQELLSHIEQYCCHVTSVFDPEDVHPQFTYSSGIQKTTGFPEIVVCGLKPKLAAAIVNDYCDRLRAGERFVPDEKYEGFLEGFAVYFTPVSHEHYDDYFGSNLWLYKGPHFDVLQLIWPSTSGIWPWEDSAGDWLRKNQPILGPRPFEKNGG